MCHQKQYYKCSGGGFQKISVGESVAKIQFVICFIGLNLVAEQNLNPHTNAHRTVSSNNEYYQLRLAEGLHNQLPILWSIHVPKIQSHLQHYKGLQGYDNLNIQLFFVFFLRGVRIETTQPLRTAVALLHGKRMDHRIKKMKGKGISLSKC